MAQSAVKEHALLGIEPFWEKPTLESPLRWEHWHITLKLAILAKEGISINTLSENTPDKVILPPEPIYEENVANSTAQSERDRKTRNEQLKNARLNRCQKTELAVILCGDRPWKFCDNKAVSLTYLCLGMEGLRIFGTQERSIQIDRIFTKDLWECLDQVSTKRRNITFGRYTFLNRKQLKGEPVEKFYGCLRKRSLNCDLGSLEESIIRDVFIANIQDDEIQRELLKERRTLKKVWKWRWIMRWAYRISWRCLELLFIRLQMKSRLHPSLTSKVLGTDCDFQRGTLSKLQFVPTVAMGGRLLINKNALLVGRIAKAVELQIILQEYVESLNNHLKWNPELIMLTIQFPRQQRWVLQQPLASRLTVLIDCFKNTVFTMQTMILIMMISMTIVLQQSPLIITLEK